MNKKIFTKVFLYRTLQSRTREKNEKKERFFVPRHRLQMYFKFILKDKGE